jgi:hypothetical protein
MYICVAVTTMYIYITATTMYICFAVDVPD